MHCSVRASEGYLYPLQKSFIFISKPVLYIKFEDVLSIEFSRVNQGAASSNRSFDLQLKTKRGQIHQFTGIDRNEHRSLVAFLEKKNLELRNVDDQDVQPSRLQSHLEMAVEDDAEDDESFEASSSDN